MPTLPFLSCVNPTWCPFRILASAGEAAEVAASCLFSLETLEVAFTHGTTNFALTEQEHVGVWRWAIINADGLILDDRREPTQAQAQRIAGQRLGFAAA